MLMKLTTKALPHDGNKLNVCVYVKIYVRYARLQWHEHSFFQCSNRYQLNENAFIISHRGFTLKKTIISTEHGAIEYLNESNIMSRSIQCIFHWILQVRFVCLGVTIPIKKRRFFLFEKKKCRNAFVASAVANSTSIEM